jgi:Na+/melibiose symporter-like transporter
MNELSQKLAVGEKIGYSLGDLAANLVFQTLVTYLAYYYTDVYGLKPKDAAAIIFFVGVFAAFVFNPVMGAIADRTNTKWGKFRPWILWTAVPLGVISLLTFSTPNFSESGMIIYAVITYTLLLMLYAANNLPYAALSGVITSDMGERNSISSYRFVAVMVAQFFVQVFMYDLIFKFGDGDKAVGMSKLMTLLAIIGTVLLLITFFTTKERVIPNPEQKSSVLQDLQDLFKNIPWVIMLLLTTLVFITLAMKGGSYVYYFENYVSTDHLTEFLQPMDGFLKALGLSFESATSMGLGLFNAGGILFMIVGIAFSKSLADRFGKRDIFGIFLFVSTIFILLFYFFPSKSIGLMFASQILHGFFYGITIPILWAMIADVADYSEWKNNRRATAIIFSAMMVGLKLGLSIGGALVSGILGGYDYDADLLSQAAKTINGIKLLVSVFPSIPFLISAGLLFFYEINKKMEDQIEQDLNERRK